MLEVPQLLVGEEYVGLEEQKFEVSSGKHRWKLTLYAEPCSLSVLLG